MRAPLPNFPDPPMGPGDSRPHDPRDASARPEAAGAAERAVGHLAVFVSANPKVQRAAIEALSREKLAVRSVDSVREALAVIETLAPGVLVLDFSGMNTADWQRWESRDQQRTRHLPTIVLCPGGGARPVEAAALGAADLIEPPFTWESIARRAARLAEAHATLAALSAVSALRRQSSGFRPTVLSAGVDQTTDALTGLESSRQFESSVAALLLRQEAARRRTAVLVARVGDLTAVDDTFGRSVAEELLRIAAKRLKNLLLPDASPDRRGPTLVGARLGRSEFALALPIDDDESAAATAAMLLDLLSAPFSADGTDLHVRASVGFAVAPEDSHTPDRLIVRAQLAAEHSERQGGWSVERYRPRIHGATHTNFALEPRLRQALRRDEFVLHYQPLANCSTGSIEAFEALIRWNHPDRGLVAPLEFLPIAERGGLMADIGRWVLVTACRQLRQWIDQGLPPVRMNVNLSPSQVQRADLVPTVRRVLEATDLDPSLLELELSESGILTADPRIADRLRELRAIGVRLAIDDFGAGHSAVAYLRELPLDTVKIDRSWVQGIAGAPGDSRVIAAMIGMLQPLGLRVVVEGVTCEQQLEVFRALACDQFQGFLLSSPVDAPTARRMLSKK